MGAAHATAAALAVAASSRAPQAGLIFHSGRGVHYCAQPFRAKLRERCPSARRGMSRKGNCRDNACAGSFFKTLKRELETLDGRHAGAEAGQPVFMYLEAYYNRARIHSALDCVAPDDFNYGQAA
jgi:transposase InsO family protein